MYRSFPKKKKKKENLRGEDVINSLEGGEFFFVLSPEMEPETLNSIKD